ncbi:MAG: FAD-binding oxidoreductase [Thermoplasmataceae archaeon]
MSISVLYGRDISKDFSAEFNFAARKIGGPGTAWDGTLTLHPGIKLQDSARISGQVVATAGISTDLEDRVIHSMGKSSPEILAAKHGSPGQLVGGVIYPDRGSLEHSIRAILENGLKVIPYGGGSSVNGSLKPDSVHETISVDMKNFSSISIGKNFVRAGSGVTGSDLEAALWKAGYTCGNFPESFRYSTVGGWVATGAVGQESNQYGGIRDIALSISLLTSSGQIEDINVPSQSSGTTALDISLGSAGSTGIITDVTLKTFRIPRRRYYHSYLFKTFEDGLSALQQIEKVPTVARLSDETETEFAIRSSNAGGIQKLFRSYLDIRGVGNGAILIVVNNEDPWRMGIPGSVYAGGIPARLWERDRYLRPGLANVLWKAGYIPDTLETAANWEYLPDLYRDVRESFYQMKEQYGFNGVIMAHVSHLYRSGACIYFTFVISTEFNREIEILSAVRDGIIRAFLRHHGAITHHHGMGSLFRQYLDSEHVSLMNKVRDPMYGGV